ncbi:hypothetical protein Y032_0339g2952 [Ancylostoma ceylanicum]|nr:hypothetical protein Y032_0339g2952 [Ancylostoma ceylanicum]
MASKPIFRYGVWTTLLEKIRVQRRVSPLISSIGQDKTCLSDVVAVAGSQHQVPAFWSVSTPAPRSGYFDSSKGGVFATPVTFAVHFWDQRGKQVKNLQTSPTCKTGCGLPVVCAVPADGSHVINGLNTWFPKC